jgi:hypothetical protein
MKKIHFFPLLLCLIIVLSACGKEASPEISSSGETSVSQTDTGDSSSPEESSSVEIPASEERSEPEKSSSVETSEPEENPESEPSVEPEEPSFTKEDVDELAAGTILTAEELEQVNYKDLFYYELIPDEVFARMDGVSFGEGCTTNRSDLRYVRLLHTGFDGETHVGELVVYYKLADDMVYIFRTLYENQYPIEKMLLVDDYDGDDEWSMEDNNTSCFNFRPVSGSDHLSNHAYGRAIDINPLYNPYITSSGYQPSNAGDYVDRSGDNNPYQIDENDLCYQLFMERGYTWGGSWNSVKDYQHFEKE